MNKKISAIILIITILISCVSAVGVASIANKTAIGTFGTPVIDGQIDSVWDKANANVIDTIKMSLNNSYKGWFKVMWDNDYLYVISKIYDEYLDNSAGVPWDHDSFEIFIDEKHNKSSVYQADDYQLRLNYDNLVSGQYYDLDKVRGKSSAFSGGYIVEMAFPFKSEKLRQGMTIGFDVQVNDVTNLSNSIDRYSWNDREGNTSSDTSRVGNVILDNAPAIQLFNEPVYTPPKVTVPYMSSATINNYALINNVTTTFDSKSYNYPVLLINEYPCMEISDLANVIEGVVNGTSLSKDDMTITFTENERLAIFGEGHIMLERSPTIYDGRFYVPVSSLMTTLGYNMQYKRFDNLLELSSGTDYPQEAEVVIYAHDYGAVGDGIRDDGKAIERAIRVALSSGVPSRVELDVGKTYLIGERNDRWAYFLIEDKQNFTFEGNGSNILFKKPTNSFIRVDRSKNIQIKNLTIDYKELPFAQGKILSVNKSVGSFHMLIDEGYPLPAPDYWAQNFNMSNAWFFGMLMDPIKDRMKITKIDHAFIQSVKPIQGREYEITLTAEEKTNINYFEVNDRFLLNTRWTAYDISEWSKDEGPYTFTVKNCSDILFEGVYVYSTPWMLALVFANEGRVKFKNSGLKIKPGSGRLATAVSDGLHCAMNKVGIIVEDCTFQNNFDDFINIHTVAAKMQKVVDKRNFQTNYNQNMRVGDEIIFYDQINKKILKTAYLKSFQDNAGVLQFTVDRDIEGVVSSDVTSKPTLIFDVDSSGRGSIVRNSTFENCRRHSLLLRAPNSIFENNIVTDGGGGAVSGSNELGMYEEAPFPSALTFRNNIVTVPDTTEGYYPVGVFSHQAPLGVEAVIDGFLMEGNTIHGTNLKNAVFINGVKNLYMLNNTIDSDQTLLQKTVPIFIMNSQVVKFDGLNVNYKQQLNTVISFIGCLIDEKNITNINVTGTIPTKTYLIQ